MDELEYASKECNAILLWPRAPGNGRLGAAMGQTGTLPPYPPS
jgi:hypothetical protein